MKCLCCFKPQDSDLLPPSSKPVTAEPEFETFKELRNLFSGINSASLFILADRYDNPIPTRFLAPIDYLKIPALAT